jgi:hypothetical protein
MHALLVWLWNHALTLAGFCSASAVPAAVRDASVVGDPRLAAGHLLDPHAGVPLYVLPAVASCAA